MSTAAIQRGCLPIWVLALLVASAFGVGGGKIVDSGQIDYKSGLWRAFVVYVNSCHNLPEFMAAVTVTISLMVVAAPVGDTFSTVSVRNRFIPLSEPAFMDMVTVPVTVDRWRRS
jgi:hypothetical protein